MKKLIVLSAAMAFGLAFTTAAFAQGNSEPGGDRYNELLLNANPDAQCETQAVSGAFGFYGLDNNRGIASGGNHPDRGAGTDHGFNNAVICGTPTDAAPPS